jgi:hypothetical protein
MMRRLAFLIAGAEMFVTSCGTVVAPKSTPLANGAPAPPTSSRPLTARSANACAGYLGGAPVVRD